MQTEVVIKNAKFVESTFADGSKQLVGVVRGDGFHKILIPTKPNPRQFIGENNPNYKEMVKTLKTEPEMFTRKNSGGITIFATACDSNGDGSYTLKFNDGDGIANGGHTYFALKSHGTTRSQVRMTIEIGLQREHIIDVAESLNLSRKLQYTTLQDKKGVFNWHKEALGEQANHVVYHEGDEGFIEIKEDLAFLNLFKYDFQSHEMNILNNLEHSERINTKTLAGGTPYADSFEQALKWIAKDVHEISMYTIRNENYATLLKPFKRTNKQNWLKRRTSDGEVRILKGLALLLVSGLAAEATKVNKLGITSWKKEYADLEVRKYFMNELFKKVIDVISVEDGSTSEIIRQPAVRKKVLKHARLLSMRITSEAAAKRKAG